MQYSFNIYNNLIVDGITNALKEYGFIPEKDVIMCIGTDGVIGDSLAPIIGSILKKELPTIYVYGSLSSPIMASDVEKVGKLLKNIHVGSKILAIDAAVGKEDDVGVVKVMDVGIKPGQGVQKDIEKIGDISIIGVVAKKSAMNYSLLSGTRLGFVYKMAEAISQGIINYEKCYKVG